MSTLVSGRIEYTVELSEAAIPEDNPALGYRAVVTITAIEGADDAAGFCYLLQAPTTAINEEVSIFDHVCNVADMQDFQMNAPFEGDSFWRSNVADLIFYTTEERDQFLEWLQEDFRILSDGWDAVNNLSEPDPVIVPSSLTEEFPRGVAGGDGTSTISVTFPVELDGIPQVYIKPIAGKMLTVENITTTGFDIRATTPISAMESIAWAVLRA